MGWEEILPAVASAGKTVDIGFGSLVEYLTKIETLNPPGSDDPVEFIYPLYVFKGGAFVSFNPQIPALDQAALAKPEVVKDFLSKRGGAQKSSVYEMVLFSLATKAGVAPNTLQITDIPMSEGFLAAQKGSLDFAAAGLTQITETKKLGGRVLVTMDDLGFADVTGFICKRSVCMEKRPEIEAAIRMWFESVAWVKSDLANNSKASLAYLDKHASTRYTFEQYSSALSQEYFPLNLAEAATTTASVDGKFSTTTMSTVVADYLVANKKAEKRPAAPVLWKLN